MKFKAAVASCPGKALSTNSDNFYFNSKIITEELSTNQILLSHKKEQKGLQIYAVSDGGGTESYRESPSLIAMNTLLKYHKKILADENYDLRVCLREYIQEANNAVFDKIRVTGKKMTTTVALIFVEENAGICCNIGHSRIYRYRDKTLTKLSVDHTQAMRMVNLGLLTEEKAVTHPKRGKLLQNFGHMPDGVKLEPHIELFPIEEDDTYVLCTYGFYDCIKEEKINEVLALDKSPAETVELLMSEAVNKGLEEDATVLVVKSYNEAKVIPPAQVSTTKPHATPVSREHVEVKPITNTSASVKPKISKQEPLTFKDVILDIWGNLGKNKNSNGIQWPALTVFVLSIALVVVMSVFGIKLFNIYAGDQNLFPKETFNTIAPGAVTPTPNPSAEGTPGNNVTPTQEPSNTPTNDPTDNPTDEPTNEPTKTPGSTPTPKPTEEPTKEPTNAPTPEPTQEPTAEPTDEPEIPPTEEPMVEET